ncbi:hypothetical protein YC2023_081392 [Brassica napus]
MLLASNRIVSLLRCQERVSRLMTSRVSCLIKQQIRIRERSSVLTKLFLYLNIFPSNSGSQERLQRTLIQLLQILCLFKQTCTYRKIPNKCIVLHTGIKTGGQSQETSRRKWAARAVVVEFVQSTTNLGGK